MQLYRMQRISWPIAYYYRWLWTPSNHIFEAWRHNQGCCFKCHIKIVHKINFKHILFPHDITLVAPYFNSFWPHHFNHFCFFFFRYTYSSFIWDFSTISKQYFCTSVPVVMYTLWPRQFFITPRYACGIGFNLPSKKVAYNVYFVPSFLKVPHQQSHLALFNRSFPFNNQCSINYNHTSLIASASY